MVYVKQLKRLYQVEGRRLFPLFGIAAICILLLQTLTLPHRFGLNCLFPNNKLVVRNGSDIQIAYSLSNSHVIRNSSIVFEVVGIGKVSSAREESGHDSVTRENGVSLENKQGIRNNLSQIVEDEKDEDELLIEEVSVLDQNFEEILTISKNDTVVQKGDKESDGGSSTTHEETTHISEEEKSFPTQHGSAISNDSVISGNTTVKKLRCDMPPKTVMTISEMNSLLLRRRASRGLLKPQWLSLQDKELLSARSQIENAPIIRGNPELYAPLFRNVSMFKSCRGERARTYQRRRAEVILFFLFLHLLCSSGSKHEFEICLADVVEAHRRGSKDIMLKFHVMRGCELTSVAHRVTVY
ncbi:hypothetical protein ACHQM5_025497 [Ranunculus cassubicifolius]